jgi:hypothetical protein
MSNDPKPPSGVPTPAAPVPRLWCTDCRAPVTQYYALDDNRPVCGKCRVGYAAKIARGEGPQAMVRAILYGLGGALAGAALIAILIETVGFGRLIAALGIGWIVAWAINRATGDYFDQRYRILAVVLTYFAVGLGSLAPVVVALVNLPDEVVVAEAEVTDDAAADDDEEYEEYEQYRGVEEIALAEYDSVRAAHAEQRAKSSEQLMAEGLSAGSVLDAALGMVIMFFTLPLLSIFAFGIHGAVVGVLALGYGMYKAWEMTGKGVAYTISGPYRVGHGPVSPSL